MEVWLFAEIAPAAPDRERKVLHLWNNAVMPWARVLVLNGSEPAAPEGAMMFRYGGSACEEFGGDTWHESVEDGKSAAQFEYEELLGEWRAVPSSVSDATEYAIQQVKTKAGGQTE